MQKQKENFKKINYFIFAGIAIALLFYTSLRAHLLSLTCDEASTYFSHLPNAVFQCFFSESCWSDANNHLLNTFLMQGSVQVFGVSELSLRLPNLLGHGIYLIFSILLICRFSKNIWIALAGFCLLNLNPYLLEFFSLARGYGLGVGWMMMSIYFLMRWVDRPKIRWGIYCYTGAFLAVMSNFVFLNFFAALTGIYIFFLLENSNWKKQNIYQNSFFKIFSIPLLTALVLFFLLKKPVEYLSTKNEFVYGTESLAESFVNLVVLSLQGQGYFNPNTKNVFVLLSLVLLSFSIVFGILIFIKKRKNDFSKSYFTAIGLMILMIAGLMVQYHLLGTKYLDGRKATMFLPHLGLIVFLFLEYLFREKNIKYALGLAILISIFSINHLYRTANFKKSTEWSYDAQTKNMVLYLDEILPEKTNTQVGVYYIFEPATHFYQEQLEVKDMWKLSRIYDDEFRELDQFDFIYIQKKDIGKVPNSFILQKEFEDAGFLFKPYRDSPSRKIQ